MHRPSAIGIVNCLCLPVLFSRQADLATHVEWIVLHTNIYIIEQDNKLDLTWVTLAWVRGLYYFQKWSFFYKSSYLRFEFFISMQN